jgi:hypothetical protein
MTSISNASIHDISEALVKEYLTVHGYSTSLEAFKKERKATLTSISSRRDLAHHLGIKKAIELNKQKGFITYLYANIFRFSFCFLSGDFSRYGFFQSANDSN